MTNGTALSTSGGALAPILEGAERVAVLGDLSKLSGDERLQYYSAVCRSLGLNPLTKPFQYVTLNGRLTLYATKDATDQLRARHGVTVEIVSRERLDDIYVVTARGILPNGRHDEEIGAVPIVGLKAEALANALMKATTKAKRRVTLSLVGLGWLDETELETVADARPVRVDADTGEIVEAATTPASAPERVKPATWARYQQRVGEVLERHDAGVDVPETLYDALRLPDDAPQDAVVRAGLAIKAWLDSQPAIEAEPEPAPA